MIYKFKSRGELIFNCSPSWIDRFVIRKLLWEDQTIFDDRLFGYLFEIQIRKYVNGENPPANRLRKEMIRIIWLKRVVSNDLS